MQAAGGCSSSAGAAPCRKPGPPQERGEPAVRFRRAQHGFCWSVLHESGQWHDPGPLFAGGMLVSPDDGTVDQRHRLERSGRQCLENPKPNAHPDPSAGSGRMWTVTLGKVAPGPALSAGWRRSRSGRAGRPSAQGHEACREEAVQSAPIPDPSAREVPFKLRKTLEARTVPKRKPACECRTWKPRGTPEPPALLCEGVARCGPPGIRQLRTGPELRPQDFADRGSLAG